MTVSVEGYETINDRLVEVSSSDRFPRLPGGECGCVRKKRGDMNVVVLCARHQQEPGIFRYMLP